MANLGYKLSDQTVGNILVRHDVPPAPKRKHTTNWKDFIRTHLDVLAGTDFFTVEVVTLKGLITYYVLFFIHLGSRRVCLAGMTPHPDEKWMQQMARNVTLEQWGFLGNCRRFGLFVESYITLVIGRVRRIASGYGVTAAPPRLFFLSFDGRVMYGLRHPWRNGATSVIFEPLDLIAKLAALVPPPRFNLVRYHGIFAPASRWRSKIVPSDPVEEEPQSARERKPCGCHPRNYTWSELMRRVFGFDVLRCECGGRMRILCAINPPDAIRKILDCLGLPSRPPPAFPAVEAPLDEF